MKRQHILLFSDHRRAAAELPVQAGDDYRLTYCANDNRDVDRIERVQQPFDWVLIDAAAMGGDQKEFFRSLRAMGLLFSKGSDHGCAMLPCGVEWDERGTLYLRCARRRATGGGSGCRREESDDDSAAFTFEYHAPMERTG